VVVIQLLQVEAHRVPLDLTNIYFVNQDLAIADMTATIAIKQAQSHVPQRRNSTATGPAEAKLRGKSAAE
jgi:hypothetical protein